MSPRISVKVVRKAHRWDRIDTVLATAYVAGMAVLWAVGQYLLVGLALAPAVVLTVTIAASRPTRITTRAAIAAPTPLQIAIPRAVAELEAPDA